MSYVVKLVFSLTNYLAMNAKFDATKTVCVKLRKYSLSSNHCTTNAHSARKKELNLLVTYRKKVDGTIKNGKNRWNSTLSMNDISDAQCFDFGIF